MSDTEILTSHQELLLRFGWGGLAGLIAGLLIPLPVMMLEWRYDFALGYYGYIVGGMVAISWYVLSDKIRVWGLKRMGMGEYA